MDNSVPSYPLQERLKSMDDNGEALESSEMTWTLSQLIRKVHKVNQQDNVPKEIEWDKPIQMPVDTLVQVYDEFTHEPSPVDTPVQVYDEFTHESSPVDTPVQRPDEFTHESNPQTQQGCCETFKSYCEISSSRSL